MLSLLLPFPDSPGPGLTAPVSAPTRRSSATRGQSAADALAPWFHDRGPDGPTSAGEKKRGVPRRYVEEPGINITPAIRKLMVRGYKRFYVKEKQPLADAYMSTLRAYFSKGTCEKHGRTIPTLCPTAELPTYEQFRHHSEQYRKNREAQLARERAGSRDFDLKQRPVLPWCVDVRGHSRVRGRAVRAVGGGTEARRHRGTRTRPFPLRIDRAGQENARVGLQARGAEHAG